MTAEADCLPLRLLAMDTDDLAIISAHLQDARIAVSDLAYLPAERKFALVGHRYDWVKAAAGVCERVAMGLHFECVRSVSRTGFSQDEEGRVLDLLAIVFEPTEPPGGTILITFQGGAAIRLGVECLEAQMRDFGERQPCGKPPAHAVA